MRFEGIASRYDLTNSVLSLGQHRRWKRRLIRVLRLKDGEILLDAGTGTGDLALLAAAAGVSIVGVDLSPKMLGIAAHRALQQAPGVPTQDPSHLGARARGVVPPTGRMVRLIRGDLSHLPLGSGSVTAVVSAFVLRHLPDLNQVFQEFRRVLVPGGRVAVLEFGQPAPWLRPFYDAFSVALVPAVGGLLTGDRGAYEFLVRSIRTFPEPAQIAGVMAGAGIRDVRWRPLNAGIAVFYLGSAPTRE